MGGDNNYQQITPFPQNAYGSLGEALAIPLQAYAAKKFHDIQFEDLLKQYMLKSRVEGQRVNSSPSVRARPGTGMADPNQGGMETVVPMDRKESIIDQMFPQFGVGGGQVGGMGGGTSSPTPWAPAQPIQSTAGGMGGGLGDGGPMDALYEYATGMKPTKMADPNILEGIYKSADAEKIPMPTRPTGRIPETDLTNYEQAYQRGMSHKQWKLGADQRELQWNESIALRKQIHEDNQANKAESASTRFYNLLTLMPQRMEDLQNKTAKTALGDKFVIGGYEGLDFPTKLELEKKMADTKINDTNLYMSAAKDAKQEVIHPINREIQGLTASAALSKDPIVQKNLATARILIGRSIKAKIDPVVIYRNLIDLLDAKPGVQE